MPSTATPISRRLIPRASWPKLVAPAALLFAIGCSSSEDDGSGTGGTAGAGGAAGSAGSTAGAGGSAGTGGAAGTGGTAGTGGAAGTSMGGAAGTGAMAGAGGSAGGSMGTASTEITPSAGGTLSLDGVTVTVPPGAVASPVTITIAVIDPTSVAGLPRGVASAGSTYALLPHGQTFSAPVSITLPHTSTSETYLLDVVRLDDEADTTWEKVSGATIDTSTVSFETTSFSVLNPVDLAPQVLVDVGPPGVSQLALSGTTLHYSVAHPSQNTTLEIRSVDVVSGTTSDVIPAGPTPDGLIGIVEGMTSTSSRVLFVLAGELFAMSTGGGGLTRGDTVGTNRGMVNDGSTMFLANNGTSNASKNLTSADGNGGIVDQLVFDITLPIVPTAVALDGSTLLFNTIDASANELLQRVDTDLSPTSVTTVIPAGEIFTGARVSSIEPDASDIFVLAYSNPMQAMTIYRKPRAGGAIETVTDPFAFDGRSMVLVDPYLYYAGGAGLFRVLKTATNATTTERLGAASLGDMVTDDTFIYYVSGTRIMGIRKPL